MDLNQLADELKNDPTGIGYTTDGVLLEDKFLLDKINAMIPDNEVTIGKISTDELVGCLYFPELSSLSPEASSFLWAVIGSGRDISTFESNIKTTFHLVFTEELMPVTRSLVFSKIKRDGSRAETLWGASTKVTANQIGAATNIIEGS